MRKKVQKVEEELIIENASTVNVVQPQQENSVRTRETKVAWWHYLLPTSILVFLTSLFYFPSLRYPFQFDDIANISKKFAIRFDNPLARWWTNSRWFGDWLNRLNYDFGRFNPFYYRLVNVTIHIIAGLLVFFIVRELCNRFQRKPFLYENSLLIAFTTAALFLLHPVQAQTVSYVIQARIEGVASLAVIAIVFCFIKATTAVHAWARMLNMVLLFVLPLIAWGTKEIVIVTPILLLLVDWFFIAQENWSDFKNRLVLHGIFCFYFFGLAVHYLSPHFFSQVAGFNYLADNNRGNILTPHAYDAIMPTQFLISEFKVILHYLWMFVWPFGISVEYDWKLAQSFWSFDSLIPFLGLVVIYGYAFYTMLAKKFEPIAFGLFWFLVCVLPRSSIIPSPELICDYKTYLASVGWLFILASGIVFVVTKVLYIISVMIPKFSANLMRHDVPVYVLTVCMLPLGLGSFLYNKIWETNVKFWEYNAAHAPLKARVHNNYGVALNEAGRIDDSIKAYQQAIALDKNYSDPLSNIAVAYCLKNEVDKAVDSLKAALHICPNYPEAYNNLGTLYIRKKQYDDAERMLNEAIKLRSYYGKAYYNLGRMYLEKNDQQTAWGYFKKAIEGDLDTPEGFYTFAQMSMRLGKYQDATRAFEQALERGCNNEQIWFGLANAAFMEKNYERARSVYTRLMRDNPLEPKYMYNLAQTFLSQKDYPHAYEAFKKITTMPRPLPEAFLRVAECLSLMKKYPESLAYLENLLKLNAPNEFKEVVKKTMTQVTLQSKISEGKGSISLTDFKKALAISKSAQKKPSDKQTEQHNKKQTA